MDSPPVTLQQAPPPDHAAPAQPAGAWVRGESVRVRGDRWRVEGGRPFADCHLLRLAGIGASNRGRRFALLYPFDRPQPMPRSGRLCRVSRRRWLHALRALVAGATPAGRLRTLARARIDLHPYQLEPALAVLNGLAARLLLADEVGLGKTIQAAILVSELQSRDETARTLILTPAGLRDQWASELRERFSIEAAVVDAATIRRTAARIAAGTNPWSVWPVIVASLDFVKRPEVLRALDPFIWDALLVDEAHTCASAPERSAAVNRLAARSRHVVLMTATPHAGDDQAFAALCSIGELHNPAAHNPAACPERSRREAGSRITMFRRARPDVGLARNRRVRLFRVRPTGDERRMHRLLGRYTHVVWTSPDAGAEARLAMIVLRKRALSSAVSLARSLERRLEALFDDGPLGAQLALPFAGSAEPDDQSPEDDEPLGHLGAPGMDGRREREWLMRVLEAARRAAGGESKIARLSRLLRRAREPALIFTEYRDTARWLASTLAPPGPVVLLHGGLSRAERLDAERAFRSGAADVLVATDAAGEGLNLQHRCRLVVNLELPWNPMRLEQRIGRVDRLGQRRRPHAIHLVAAATAEEHIVRRLLFRQERARRAVGCVSDAVGATSEENVAQAVMSGEIGACRMSPAADGDTTRRFSTLDLRGVAIDEAKRLEGIRALAGDAATRAPAAGNAIDATPLSVLPPQRARQSGLPRGVVCVFVVRLLDARDGEVVDESLVALHLELRASPADLDRTALDLLVHSDTLRDRALAVASARLAAAASLYRRTALTARAREETLAAAERRRAAPLQPGMFDRRALRDAEREQCGRAARESEEADRLRQLDGRAAGEEVAQAEPALVLVVDR